VSARRNRLAALLPEGTVVRYGWELKTWGWWVVSPCLIWLGPNEALAAKRAREVNLFALAVQSAWTSCRGRKTTWAAALELAKALAEARAAGADKVLH
jgi:hypothetical protein